MANLIHIGYLLIYATVPTFEYPAVRNVMLDMLLL